MRHTDGRAQERKMRECNSDKTKEKRYSRLKDILICLIFLLVMVIETLFVRELVHAYNRQKVNRQLAEMPIPSFSVKKVTALSGV